MNQSSSSTIDMLSGAWSNELAQNYVDQWGELLLHRRVPQFCQLNPSETVLDIGCGSGAAVREIANQLTSGSVTGIDPTPKMIELAKKLNGDNSKLSFLLADAESIPAADDSFDVVIAINSLHHWDQVERGLHEVLRVLKSGGRFVTIDDLWEELPEYNELSGEDKVDPNCHYNLKSRAGIVALLAADGFVNISNNEHREEGATASIISGFKA